MLYRELNLASKFPTRWQQFQEGSDLQLRVLYGIVM